MLRSKRARRIIFVILLSGCALAGVMAFRFWRSGDPAHTFELARAALRSGDFEVVQRSIERLEGAPEYAAHRCYLKGSLLLRKGDLTGSLAEFAQAVDQPEFEVDALILSGQALYQMRHAAEAHRLWERALKLNPASINAHRWLGVLYYDLGAIDLALTHLEQASRLAPDDPRPARLMGLICKDFERYPAAVGWYQECLARDADQPDHDQILLELAESQIKLSQYDSALGTLERCVRSAEQLALQAECHYGLGDADQAQRIIGEALELSPEYLPSLLLRGRILLEKGHAAETAETLSRAAALSPKDYSVHHVLVQAYARLGEQTKAREHSELAEKYKNASIEFSELHLRASKEPLNADLRYQLGKMAQELDRVDLARMWFKAALAIDPTHAGAAKALRPAR